MHGTSIGPSLSARGRKLPCMRWTLWTLQRLQVVLVPILLRFGEKWGRPKQQRVQK